MVVRGHIESGQIVLDDEAELPEGARVKIEVVESVESTSPKPAATLYDSMKPFAGIFKDLPPDFAENHDHYIHGRPKK